MTEFTFARPTPEAVEYCEAILSVVEERLGVGRDVAIAFVNKYWHEQDFAIDDYRYHDIPYYWAMSMIHGAHGDRNSKWYCDPTEWPGPSDEEGESTGK